MDAAVLLVSKLFVLTHIISGQVTGNVLGNDYSQGYDDEKITFSNIRGIPKDELLGFDEGAREGAQGILGLDDTLDDITFGYNTAGSGRPMGFDDRGSQGHGTILDSESPVKHKPFSFDSAQDNIMLNMDDILEEVESSKEQRRKGPLGFDDAADKIVLGTDDVFHDVTFTNKKPGRPLGFDVMDESIALHMDDIIDEVSFAKEHRQEGALGFGGGPDQVVLGREDVLDKISFSNVADDDPLGFEEEQGRVYTVDDINRNVRFKDQDNNRAQGGPLGFDDDDDTYKGVHRLGMNEVVDDVKFNFDTGYGIQESGRRGDVINMDDVEDQTVFNVDKGGKFGYENGYGNSALDCAAIQRQCQCNNNGGGGSGGGGGTGAKGNRRGKGGGLGADKGTPSSSSSIEEPPDYSTDYP